MKSYSSRYEQRKTSEKVKYLQRILKAFQKHYSYKKKLVWKIEIWAYVIYVRFVEGKNVFVSHKLVAMLLGNSSEFKNVKNYITCEFIDYKLERDFQNRQCLLTTVANAEVFKRKTIRC
jgi:hypothetical protein